MPVNDCVMCDCLLTTTQFNKFRNICDSIGADISNTIYAFICSVIDSVTDEEISKGGTTNEV